MANIVTTLLDFHNLNDDAKAWLNAFKVEMGDNLFEFRAKYENVPLDEAEEWDWRINCIGAKWAYFVDFTDEHIQIESAWETTEAFTEWFLGELHSIDHEAIVSVSYEDEMPNFYGVNVYTADGHWDGFHSESEDLRDELNAEFPELKEQFITEDEDYTEDGWELYQELVWEHIANEQATLISHSIDDIQEARKNITIH